jgi:hypothetical protein
MSFGMKQVRWINAKAYRHAATRKTTWYPPNRSNYCKVSYNLEFVTHIFNALTVEPRYSPDALPTFMRTS